MGKDLESCKTRVRKHITENLWLWSSVLKVDYGTSILVHSLSYKFELKCIGISSQLQTHQLTEMAIMMAMPMPPLHVYMLSARTEIDEYWVVMPIHPLSFEGRKTGCLNANVWSSEFVDRVLKTGGSSEALMQAKLSFALLLSFCSSSASVFNTQSTNSRLHIFERAWVDGHKKGCNYSIFIFFCLHQKHVYMQPTHNTKPG